MGFLYDALFAIPIAIIYDVLCYKIADVSFKDLPYKDKFQNTLTFLFVAGLIAIIIGQTLFKTNSNYKNPILQKGFVLGGILLIIYTILMNWDKMTDENKLLIIVIIFGMLLWWVAGSHVIEKEGKKKKKKVNHNTN
ncbi:MAG: hypothetical protein Edafosvirus12_4 [Edafosvirus sp.]|uniref:Uncharacterized protein n=1 Tax=Edafosvirus sp. TaxID=2487765 RepID=A0A3G4ZU34_9VIRU|nr:MAG: hypothetical protein Edafosvirus12_4 [Edafosvirus sp.]